MFTFWWNTSKVYMICHIIMTDIIADWTTECTWVLFIYCPSLMWCKSFRNTDIHCQYLNFFKVKYSVFVHVLKSCRLVIIVCLYVWSVECILSIRFLVQNLLPFPNLFCFVNPTLLQFTQLCEQGPGYRHYRVVDICVISKILFIPNRNYEIYRWHHNCCGMFLRET